MRMQRHRRIVNEDDRRFDGHRNRRSRRQEGQAEVGHIVSKTLPADISPLHPAVVRLLSDAHLYDIQRLPVHRNHGGWSTRLLLFRLAANQVAVTLQLFGFVQSRRLLQLD